MTTTLSNFSEILNTRAKQIYQVPNNKTAIVLNIAIAPVGESAKVLLWKQAVDNSAIVLIPDKVVVNNDIYFPPLDKLILLAGEKIFARAILQSAQPQSFAWLGIPCVFKVNNLDLVHFSLSVAEKNA